jgi:gluconate 5-dehydrogenase
MTLKLFDLTGRVALVTGSSAGLGRAIARGLAEAGATVAVNGRDPDRLARAVEELRADGHAAHGYRFDVTSEQAVLDAVARIEAEVGPIDILVNNAGIQRRAPLTEVSLEIWEDVLTHNLTSVFLVGRTVARAWWRAVAARSSTSPR